MNSLTKGKRRHRVWEATDVTGKLVPCKGWRCAAPTITEWTGIKCTGRNKQSLMFLYHRKPWHRCDVGRKYTLKHFIKSVTFTWASFKLHRVINLCRSGVIFSLLVNTDIKKKCTTYIFRWKELTGPSILSWDVSWNSAMLCLCSISLTCLTIVACEGLRVSPRYCISPNYIQYHHSQFTHNSPNHHQLYHQTRTDTHTFNHTHTHLHTHT